MGFVSFRTASAAIRAGHAGAVYKPAAHALAEHILFPHARPDFYGFLTLLALPIAFVAREASQHRLALMGEGGVVGGPCVALGGKTIGDDDRDRVGARRDRDPIGGRRPAGS